MRLRWLLVVLVLAGAAAAGAAIALARRSDPPDVQATISVREALGGADTAGFARAVAPREFSFPRDHGPHPGFRNEWWYVTGNVETAGGRRFGYQLTFFRTALAPGEPVGGSEWRAYQVYMAHLALTDVEGRKFHAFDRFARAAVGLAGAEAGAGWRVWLEDWALGGVGPAGSISISAPQARLRVSSPAVSPISIARPTPNGRARDRERDRNDFRARDRDRDRNGSRSISLALHAAEGAVALDLRLAPGKLPVLQGDHGLSRKGPEPGSASYYYSLTRMPTAGAIRVGADTFRVSGASWMDREWSTSALSRDETGWDWFALQLGDGRELMLYRIRRRDGGISPFSGGSIVAADGRSTTLSATDVQLDVLDHWTSPRGDRYPARWRVRVPSAGLDLDVRPVLADQELNLAVRYWEGAVDVSGTGGGRPVSGRGYVELTGYDEAAEGGAEPRGIH